MRSDHRADLFGNKKECFAFEDTQLGFLGRFWSLFWKVLKERLDKYKNWMVKILTGWKDKISLTAFPEL